MRARTIVGTAVLILLCGAPTAQADDCDDGVAASTLVRHTITFGGEQRTYLLSLPPDAGAVPLLVTLHGTASDACAHAQQSAWAAHPGSSERSYAIAFPNATRRVWSYSAGSADVGFLRAVVADVRFRAAIDTRRVFVSGHSNGAFMAQRAACDAADVFAAAAEYAGGSPSPAFGADDCLPSRGIAIGMWHGERDFVVPALLGTRSRDAWAARLACSSRAPTAGEAPLVVHSGCRDGVRVEWNVLTGQGHLWPAGTAMQDAMWAFFDAFPMP